MPSQARESPFHWDSSLLRSLVLLSGYHNYNIINWGNIYDTYNAYKFSRLKFKLKVSIYIRPIEIFHIVDEVAYVLALPLDFTCYLYGVLGFYIVEKHSVPFLFS